MQPEGNPVAAEPISGGVEVATTGASGAGGIVAGWRSPLLRFYGYQILVEFSFTAGIWILYLQHRGYTLAEIGLAESAFHLAPITLELVSGSLADLFGRKWSLAIASGCVALSALLMLRADSLWIVLVSMYVGGASYAFRSGAIQAFLYDSLAELGVGDRFTGVFGRLFSATYLMIAATTWVGAWLADRSFAIPYGLTVAAGLSGVVLAANLREPARERLAHRSVGWTIGEALRIVRTHPGLASILLSNTALFTLLALVGLYAQAVLADFGFPPSRVGLIIGATLLFTAVGAWFAERLGRLGSFPAWTAGTTAAVAAAGVGMGSGALAVGVAAYFLAEFVSGAYEPLVAAKLNEGISSAQRATILSVEGFLYSITMVWAFPLFGLLVERSGWLAAYAVAGGIVVALVGSRLLVDRRRAESSLAATRRRPEA